ncbi:MAG TPA: hypothetical protein VJL80_09810 [Aeromicrobium sp.]|nr:hypothetical protein [Aeromicrobium sp.]HKY58321.1 hypothetical protein [Aeromicrobium sp.]
MIERAGLWATFLTASAVADWFLDQRNDGSTLSEVTRWTFRTHTRPGRYAFLAVWGGFAAWFALHIVARHSRRLSPIRSRIFD